MNSSLKQLLTASIILLLFSLATATSVHSATGQNSSYPVETEMTLQVVFVGIPSTFIDTKTLDELTQSLIQVAKYDYFSIASDLTGYSTLIQTVLSFKYLFANDTYSNALRSYSLENSIHKTIENATGTGKNFTGEFIDAFKVDDWINSPAKYPSGFTPPSNGYTLFFTNFSDIGDHWYFANYTEIDTGSIVSRQLSNGFASGKYRSYFVDLSVEHSYLELFGSDGPIQNLSRIYSPNDTNGRFRIAQYFYDWIYEFLVDLFLSDLLYSTPAFKESFDTELDSIRANPPGSNLNINIYMLDNITGVTPADLLERINTTAIKEAYNDLLPWYSWKVNVTGLTIEDYPLLASAVNNATDRSSNRTIYNRTEANVDIIWLFDWVFNEILSGRYTASMPFLNVDSGSYPNIAFAFDGGVLGFGYKHIFNPGIAGIALYGAVPTSNSYRWIPLAFDVYDYEYLYGGDPLNRKFGFTRTIIHETGHLVGATHPFGLSESAGSLNDPMSYLAHSIRFSIFKKDQVQRGEIATIRFWTQKFAGQINDQGKSKNEYQDMVVADALALDRFEEMNYNASYYKAWEAMLLAQQLYNSYTVISGPSTITNTTTVTKNAEGFLALLVLIPLVFIGLRHRTNHRKI